MSVYVVQRGQKYNNTTGKHEDKFDLSHAETFGKLVFLLSPLRSPTHPEEPIAELHKILRNFSDDDLLLLTGNPCFIGFATAIAAQNNEGRVRLLQWNGRRRIYYEIPSQI